ncbi:MAG: 16S rRNA (cytosine(967)-C(5))-methyltransferase RsmB [Candidatus Acidiferrales bacterium]
MRPFSGHAAAKFSAAQISPARRIAFEVLRRVEIENAYASDALHAELGANITPADAALATEITFGTIRWQRLLDFLLERQMKKPAAKLDFAVRIALRAGLYQIRFLKRVPAHAAVSESVEMVKRARKVSAAGLVNAVLRRAAEDRTPAEQLLPSGAPLAERWGILYSHPTFLVERWLARWGEQSTRALLEANNRAPRLSCAVHGADSERRNTVESLERAGLHVEPGGLLRRAIAVSGGSPSRTEAFRHGRISIQDEASQAVPLLLDVQAGDRVLDLCAAPGGKTATLERAIGERGMVVAADRHAHRLSALHAQLQRLGLRRARLVELDAEKPLPFGVTFDKILVDAPCSGTGTLARHPEIRWRLQPEHLAELHAIQTAMLVHAIDRLAPSGRLVYSTCSLEPEENEAVVQEALAATNGDVARIFATAISPRGCLPQTAQRADASRLVQALAPHLAEGFDPNIFFDSVGDFRTSPGEQKCDGFFAAVLERTTRKS